MRKKTRNLIFSAAFLLILFVMGAGCAKTGSTLTTTSVSYVSLINEAIYASNLQMYLNDTIATTTAGVPAGSFSSQYATIRPGTYSIKFSLASHDSVISQLPTTTFDTLNFYTIICYNNPGGGSVQTTLIHDNFTTVSAASANYRFFNLSPNYPQVDLYMNTTLAQNGRSTADNVYNTGYNEFSQVSPGSYNLVVKKAGTDSVIASSANVPLIGGDAYTIFLGGIVGSTTTPLQINVLQATY